MDKTINTAEELARIGRENDLAEIEYEDGDVRIHLTFESPTAANPGFDPSLLMNALAASGGHGSAIAPLAAQASAVATPPAAAKLGETINSPLAGVFYRAPRPDANPFVKDGDSVTAGQTLCIVEAMKLMNEITADRACKVTKILVENAEAVEEGQPLFVIE